MLQSVYLIFVSKWVGYYNNLYYNILGFVKTGKKNSYDLKKLSLTLYSFHSYLNAQTCIFTYICD